MLSLKETGNTHCPSWLHVAIHLSPTFQPCLTGTVTEPFVVEAPSVGCDVRRSFVKSMTSCRKKETPVNVYPPICGFLNWNNWSCLVSISKTNITKGYGSTQMDKPVGLSGVWEDLHYLGRWIRQLQLAAAELCSCLAVLPNRPTSVREQKVHVSNSASCASTCSITVSTHNTLVNNFT